MNNYFINGNDFNSFLSSLIEKKTVIGPVAKKAKFVFARISSADKLRLDYDVTILPPKKEFFPPKQTLITFNTNEFKGCINPEEKILFGVHFYDIKGINMTDFLYTDNKKDNYYCANRDAATIVGSNIQNISERGFWDSVGAEKLLGKGDMLFLGSRSIAMERIHGAYVSDAEITRLVSHIRSQRAVSYTTIDDELLSKLPSINEKDDPLYCEIKKYLKGTEEISISQIQRHFRIGYNRSARIVEMLEYEGMVMPVQGGKLRKVIQQISNDQKE